ncbi:MAG TPA: nuclear transport factor 2 family protein [Vicinamibacterales bacterium]|nr:nuclear transport factor 2 family protein [Vicinamibacterales bacterium]
MTIALGILAAVASLAAQAAPAKPAQGAGVDPAAVVQARDDAFWRAYNACDTAAFRGFFTADVEFYHDRGGPTIGLDALDGALAKNLCGGGNRLRREPVEGTVRLSILRSGDTVYGAIVAGEHLFYVREPGRAEFLDGRARFVTLWLLKDGAWKMARLLSYDHGPATPR